MTSGYGGTKETNLTNETDIVSSDFVRIVTSGSRKITLANFLESSVPELQELGFVTDCDYRQRIITNTSAAIYTLSSANEVLLCDATGNDIEVIFPLPEAVYDAGLTKSYMFTIKKTDTSTANVINLTPTGAAEIDGEESIQLIGVDFPYFNIVTDGVNWWSV